MIPTIAPYHIPILISHISDNLPNLERIYREDITENLIECLKNGEIDITVIANRPDDNYLRVKELYNEPFRLVAPSTHPICDKENLTSSDIPMNELMLLGDGY